MEIKFRPLQPSTLARRATPMRSNPEPEQSFIELVESVSGAEDKSEGSDQSGHQRPAARKVTPREALPAQEESGETSESGYPAPTPYPEKPGEQPPGPRLDITA